MNKKIDQIIDIGYSVFDSLGDGFLEAVYQNAMYLDLLDVGFTVEKEKPLFVHYHGECVGHYFADLVVDNEIIIETKTVRKINLYHIDQVKNYLSATGIDTGLIMSFKNSYEVKRVYKRK